MPYIIAVVLSYAFLKDLHPDFLEYYVRDGYVNQEQFNMDQIQKAGADLLPRHVAQKIERQERKKSKVLSRVLNDQHTN